MKLGPGLFSDVMASYGSPLYFLPFINLFLLFENAYSLTEQRHELISSREIFFYFRVCASNFIVLLGDPNCKPIYYHECYL